MLAHLRPHLAKKLHSVVVLLAELNSVPVAETSEVPLHHTPEAASKAHKLAEPVCPLSIDMSSFDLIVSFSLR
jgi:hypothetical protein